MTTLTVDVDDIRVASAECDEAQLTVRFVDGRVILAPLTWFPRIKDATPEQRANLEISPLGLHWPDIDEDLSIAGLLAGRKAVAA